MSSAHPDKYQNFVFDLTSSKYAGPLMFATGTGAVTQTQQINSAVLAVDPFDTYALNRQQCSS